MSLLAIIKCVFVSEKSFEKHSHKTSPRINANTTHQKYRVYIIYSSNLNIDPIASS